MRQRVRVPRGHNNSNITLAPVVPYLLCTSYRFLKFTNIYPFSDHWETTPFRTVPPLKLIIWARCRSTICLLWLGSGSLLRALVRSGYRDCTRPSFISKYGLFPDLYFIQSNSWLFSQSSCRGASIWRGLRLLVASCKLGVQFLLQKSFSCCWTNNATH